MPLGARLRSLEARVLLVTATIVLTSCSGAEDEDGEAPTQPPPRPTLPATTPYKATNRPPLDSSDAPSEELASQPPGKGIRAGDLDPFVNDSPRNPVGPRAKREARRQLRERQETKPKKSLTKRAPCRRTSSVR